MFFFPPPNNFPFAVLHEIFVKAEKYGFSCYFLAMSIKAFISDYSFYGTCTFADVRSPPMNVIQRCSKGHRNRRVVVKRNVVLMISAGEHSVSNQHRKSHQDNWLRPGARLQSWCRHKSVVWNSGVHGSRGRPVWTNTFRYGHVECRRHMLRSVRIAVLCIVLINPFSPTFNG